MYNVQDEKFDDIIDACQSCKDNPMSTVTNDNGDVLMFHEIISEEEEREIKSIQIMLKIKEITKCQYFSPCGFGSISSFFAC